MCVEAGIDFIYYDINLERENILRCNIKVKQSNKVLVKMKRRVASAYGKEGKDYTKMYKLKMSKMQSCNCKTMEIYSGRYEENREGGRKGTVRFFGSLTSNKLNGVLSQNIFISFPCFVCGLSKGLLKNVCSPLLLLSLAWNLVSSSIITLLTRLEFWKRMYRETLYFILCMHTQTRMRAQESCMQMQGTEEFTWFQYMEQNIKALP